MKKNWEGRKREEQQVRAAWMLIGVLALIGIVLACINIKLPHKESFCTRNGYNSSDNKQGTDYCYRIVENRMYTRTFDCTDGICYFITDEGMVGN